MIQQNQVNKYAYSHPQGVQCIKPEDNQIHQNIASNLLTSSGGGVSNQNVFRNSNVLHCEANAYNTSSQIQTPNHNACYMNNKQIKNNIPKQNGSNIKQEENVNNNVIRLKAVSQGSHFQTPSIGAKLNTSSYGLQTGNHNQASNFSGGGDLISSQQKEGPKNHLDINNNNNNSQHMIMSDEQEISSRSKMCSFSCLPKDDQIERIIFIKGGIMIDEKVILDEVNSDYLVHQNFSQYIECNLFRKIQIQSCDNGQPAIVVVEIPFKKKKSEQQFDDLILKFKNGNQESNEIANYLERYQQFLKSKVEQENLIFSNQIMKKEELFDRNSNKNSLHLSSSGHQSQMIQPKNLSNFSTLEQQQKQLQSALLKQQSMTNESKIDLIQNQGRNPQNYNLTSSQSNENTNSKLVIKKDQPTENQSLIQKNNQLQQIQQTKQIEQGTNLNKNSQQGSKNKLNQQNQPQIQSQICENIYKNQHETDSCDVKEKIYRKEINQILLKHQSEYFSYVVVFKDSIDQLQNQHSSNLNSSFQNCSEEINPYDLLNKDEEMRIGHNTNFMTLLCQDEEQLASKMIREKKLCIFITKLNREKYLYYIKQRIQNEINNIPLSFPKTCLSSLDSIFCPIFSHSIDKKQDNSTNSKDLTKQSSLSNDEKILNPETHMNSSASSSSTLQQQNIQLLNQQNQHIQNMAQRGQYQGKNLQNSPINKMSKCPFFSQNTNIQNFITTDSEQNKVVKKTYQQIDIITLDDLIFPVNIDVVEEETAYLKVTVFKYDISEVYIKDLESNRINHTTKQSISMNTSGNGTPFQRKSNKKLSLKQNFTDTIKSRDKSVTISHPDEKIKSSSNFSTTHASFMNSFNSQDMLNPKNMQYESKSEIFLQKFYSQSEITKTVSDCGFNGNKQPGEGSASTKHGKRRQSQIRGHIQNLDSEKVQSQKNQQDEHKDLMDEEYLEQQFKMNNPTFEDNENREPIDFKEAYQYQQSEYLKNNFNTQTLSQYNSQSYQTNTKIEFQQQQIKGVQNTSNDIIKSSNQLINNQTNLSQKDNQILKIEMPQQINNQYQALTQKQENTQIQKNDTTHVFNPNQQDEKIDSIKEDQSEKSKKKTTQKNNNKKKVEKEEKEEKEKKISKTKKIQKKDDSSESQKKSANTEKAGTKKQSQDKIKEDQKIIDAGKQKDDNLNQSKLNTIITTQSEIGNNKSNNDIVSLRNIPVKQSDSLSINKIVEESKEYKQSFDQIPSQASQNQYPINLQQQSQTNLNKPVQFDQSITPNLQILQQQQLPQPYNYQYQVSPQQNVNQSMQNPNLPQQNQQSRSYPQLYMQQNQLQQIYPNMQFQNHQGHYQNQNGQIVSINGNQQFMPPQLNNNGQVTESKAQLQHIPQSPQISYSPYQYAQKPSSYSLSPNLTSQQASKSSPVFPPLDIDSQNNSLKYQGNNFSQQSNQQYLQSQQIQKQNQYQTPQLKSQPNLIQTQQSPTQDNDQKQIVSQVQPQEVQNDPKKKNKKRETKQKKQNTDKNIEDEDDEEEEQNNKNEKAPKKIKKIQKSKEENGEQIKTSPNNKDQQQKESAKPKQKKQVKSQNIEEKSHEQLNSLNNINEKDNSPYQHNQFQQNLNNESLQQQNEISQNIAQNPYNHQQQPQIQYQFQHYYPNNYMQNQDQQDYDYYNMNQTYPQAQNQHTNLQYSQQYGLQYQQQNIQNIDYQQVNHYNINGQSYQHYQQQQLEKQQPAQSQVIPSSVQPINESSTKDSNKKTKNGKESQAKSKAAKASKPTN